MKLPEPLVLNDHPAARALLFDTVENQIREHDPPAARQALARLLAAGVSREHAIAYIACVLSVEFFEIIEQQSSFDSERYCANLAALPALPYDESVL